MKPILTAFAAAILLAGCSASAWQTAGTVRDAIEAGALVYVAQDGRGAAKVLKGIEALRAVHSAASAGCQAILDANLRIVPEDVERFCGFVPDAPSEAGAKEIGVAAAAAADRAVRQAVALPMTVPYVGG